MGNRQFLSDIKHYEDYLIEENQEFLKKYSKKEREAITTKDSDGNEITL